MDPFAVGAVLLAVVTGANEALGGSLLAGVPAAHNKAVALARVLLERRRPMPGFDQPLAQWREQSQPFRAGIASGTNTIGGGSQHWPLLTGRDFRNIYFGTWCRLTKILWNLVYSIPLWRRIWLARPLHASADGSSLRGWKLSYVTGIVTGARSEATTYQQRWTETDHHGIEHSTYSYRTDVRDHVQLRVPDGSIRAVSLLNFHLNVAPENILTMCTAHKSMRKQVNIVAINPHHQ